MIDKNLRNRAVRIAYKCKDGDKMAAKANTAMQNYAAANGLTQNADGRWIDAQGNVVNVTAQQVSDWAKGNSGNSDGMGGGASSYIGGAADMLDTAISGFSDKVQDQSALTQGLNAGYDAAADVISKMGPWGAVAGTAMKVGGMASDALTAAGVGTDQISTTDQILDSKWLKLTPVGLVNAIGAKKSDSFAIDNYTQERVGGSYGGTYTELEKAEDKADKKFGLFSKKARRKANNEIAEAKEKQDIMTGIANEATDQQEMVAAMGDEAAQAYTYQTQGGYQQKANRIEKGGEIVNHNEPESIDDWFSLPQRVADKRALPKIAPGATLKPLRQHISPNAKGIEEWEPVLVMKHQNGGNIEAKLDAPEIAPTEQQNVIPEGALHKNKHHMEDADDLTKKGIPVIDDKHEQQAEIERNEIIFTKEVTDKLEELYAVYYKEGATDEEKAIAATEAGKLLTKEIMLNTDDRTGLIDALKKGGEIKKKESKPKPKAVSFDEWMAKLKAEGLGDIFNGYNIQLAYDWLPQELLDNHVNVHRMLRVNPRMELPPAEEWHLPSVIPTDKGLIFAKQGRTSIDNPELWHEFNYIKQDFENSEDPFLKHYTLDFDDDLNSWKYVHRKGTHNSIEDDYDLINNLMVLPVGPDENASDKEKEAWIEQAKLKANNK